MELQAIDRLLVMIGTVTGLFQERYIELVRRQQLAYAVKISLIHVKKSLNAMRKLDYNHNRTLIHL